jgi:hypothetical protein
MNINFPPHSKQCTTPLPIIITAIYEVTAVYSENYIKHINAMCGQNAEIFNTK